MNGFLWKKSSKIYKVVFSKSAKKDFEKLSSKTKEHLTTKIRSLAYHPFSHKSLQGFVGHVFRIRFSDKRKELRLLYRVTGDIVYVLEIVERKNEYKRL